MSASNFFVIPDLVRDNTPLSPGIPDQVRDDEREYIRLASFTSILLRCARNDGCLTATIVTGAGKQTNQ